MTTSSTRSSTSTKPTTPPHVTTVITVEQQQSPEAKSEENTHIIKVSGPVTNLDETVTSGAVGENLSEVESEAVVESSEAKVVQTSVWLRQ